MQTPNTFDSDKRKLLSSLAHGSIFITAPLTLLLIPIPISIIIPILIYFVSDDLIVKDNAKEAINFHFNVWLYGIVLVPLSIITFGLAGGIWWLIHWGLTAWAIFHCLNAPDELFRYPFIFRLLK